MMVSVYVAYLVISAGMTLWAGNVLFQHGRVFLVENFKGNEAQADSLNRLLLTGFYLFAFGLIFAAVKYGAPPETLQDSITFLSDKLGLTVIGLGFMHFVGVMLRMVMRP